MFQQSVLLRDEESRRSWTFSVSLLAQLLVVAVAILVPLLSKPMLPILGAAIVTLETPRPPQSAPPPPPDGAVRAAPPVFDSELRQPSRMPDRAAVVVDPVPGVVGTLELGLPSDASGNTLITGIVNALPAPAPPPQPEPVVEPASPASIRVGGSVQAAKVIHRVRPAYPPLARSARIEGTVVLGAVIAAEGTIAELDVVEGHPLLARAAIDAVSQWRYRPTFLNGRPVPVETQINVVFKLGR